MPLPDRGIAIHASTLLARCLLLAPLATAAFAQIDPPSTAATNPALSPSAAFRPITGKERAQWAIVGTVGPASLLGGLFSSGWGTLWNQPPEYGTHWQGFADRYGMRLTGLATSNAMEASLGAIWGEDPRYVRASGEGVGQRLGHVVKMAFLAPNKNGHLRPAFARYAAIAGSNYLSNTWRVDSEANLSRASMRVGLGFLGRIAGNAWDEFWPDLKQSFFHASDHVSERSGTRSD